MPESNSDLLIKIGGDTEGFKDSLAGLGESLLKSVAELNPIVAGIVGVIGGISVAAVEVAEGWEDATHEIIAKTGATGDSLKGLKDDWEAVFKTGDEDAKTVADALAGVNVALGITGPALQTVTRNFLDLAGITGEQVQPLIKATTQAFNEWKITGDEAASSQQLLLHVFQATGISVTDLTSQLATAGPTLHNLGLSFETSAALIGQLSKSGPGASEAIAGLSKAVANLTKEGIPAQGALDSIIASIKNAPTDTDAASAAMEVFGNKAGAKLSEQIRSGKFDLDALVTTLHNSTATISETDDATDSFSAKLGELWNNIQPILVPLGTVLVNAASDLVKGFTDLIRGVSLSSDSFSGLLTFVKPIGDAFISTKPVLIEWGTLLLGIANTITDKLQPVFSAISTVLEGFATLLKMSVIAAVKDAMTFLGGLFDVLMKIPAVASMFADGQKTLAGALDATSKSTKDLTTSTDTNKTTTEGAAKAHVDIIGALGDHKTAKELLKKATEDINGAEQTLADGYKSLFIPTIKDVATAEGDLAEARLTLESDLAVLKSKEEDLKTIRDTGKGSAATIKAAEDDLTTARQAVKDDTEKLHQAEKDLTTSRTEFNKATADMAQAEADLSNAYKTIHIPIIKDVATAEDALTAARKNVDDAITNVKQAEQDLKTLRDSGHASAADLKTAEDNLKATRDALKTATGDYKTAEGDLNATRVVAKQASADLYAAEKDLDNFRKDNLTPHAKDVKTAFEDVRVAYQNATTAAKDVSTAEDNLRTALAGGDPTKIKDATVLLTTARNDLKLKTDALHESENTVTTDFGLSKGQMDGLKKSTDDTTLSVGTLETAQLKMYQDVLKAAQDNKTNIPAEQQLQNAALIQGQKDFSKEHLTQWSDLYNSITSTVQTFAGSAIKTLFTGQGSFKDEGIAALQSLGEAVMTKFIQPFTDAIADFIAGAITNLLSGKGLKGVADALDGIMTKVGGLFGKSGTDAASDAASGAASSGSQAGSQAIGAIAGGITGLVTAVSSVVTAISSVIGNFQMAHMETSLNAIEHNTRYTMMYVGERSDGGILGQLFTLVDETKFGTTNKAAIDMDNWIKGPIAQNLNDIDQNTYWGLQKVDSINNTMLQIPSLLSQIAMKPTNVDVKVYLDSAQIAATIESTIEAAVLQAIA